MAEIKSFRDLRVWDAAMTLVEDVYRLTRAFPRSEAHGLAGQLQRAAVSVPSNIAEGHTREYSREYLRHVSVAQASLAELETQMEIACRLGYISRCELNEALERIRSLGKQLFALRNSLTARIENRPPAPNSQPPIPEESACG